MFQEGLKDTVVSKTAISLINGEEGKLVYRGYTANDLSTQYSFEEVLYLLWHGHLPNKNEHTVFLNLLKINRSLPPHIHNIIEKLPKEIDMMSKIRTVISCMGTKEFQWKPTINQAIQLTTLIPSIISILYRNDKGLDFILPNPKLNHIDNYIYMLTGKIPSPMESKLLETYMILTMEHGMNASTFAARVITSTESDMISAIVGAIGAMKGPLHGGALLGVITMLDEITDKQNAEGWIRKKLENKEKIMGFGHRIYKVTDPRIGTLKTILHQLKENNTWIEFTLYIETLILELLKEYKPNQDLYTNIDFYAAIVMRTLNIDPILFTPTFSASRIAGWTAHILEQSKNNKIFRPKAVYIGDIIS